MEENRINKIIFSDDVQTAIEQVLQSSDPLDGPNFNATDYINQLFPTEQSLVNIDEVISRMETEIYGIDDHIRTVVRGQSNTGTNGRAALDEAQMVILQLFGQISEIKSRAEKTEEIVKEITRDIKQLDCAKKNLTSAITTLNHLHMLVGGVESLTKLAEKRQYGELLNPLQAITEVNRHFQQYKDISQIQELSNKVEKIHRELAVQITKDFENAFSGTNSGTKMSMAQLKDACQVVSVLDSKVKHELLKWFINLQLQEYVQLFHENQDIAWLDKIDKRYAWLKRHLLDFEDKYGHIFPNDWDVSEQITIKFCAITRDELSKIMSKRNLEIDVKLLLFAISKTGAFEQLLAKRFSGYSLLNKPEHKKESDTTSHFPVSAVNGAAAETAESPSPYINLIGNCFKPYLYIYTDSIDRNLAEIIERFQQESTNQKFDPNVTNSTVFPSCADLFVFYKKCMVQCNQLSTSKPMFDLALIFKKYLREYAVKLLESKIPRLQTTQTSIGTSMSMLTKDLQQLSTAAGHVFQSLLKEGETIRYTRDELVRLCCVLSTAEYCLDTVQQLEEKLREKVDEEFMEKIDLSDEKNIFHQIISSCIQLLVQDMENGCEPEFILMSKIQWQNIKTVGDQSPYVNSLISNFKQTIPIIRDNLATSRKYYTQFCHRFVNSLIPKYINTLYKCRPTNLTQDGGSNSVLGCEQLLLDTHSIKTTLLDLPSIGSMVNRKAPASYTKVVVKGMTKAEMIIKIVMAPIQPAIQFVEQTLKLLPELSMVEFHKILDMKGLKRVDQANLVDLFKRIAPKENLTAITSSTISSNIVTLPSTNLNFYQHHHQQHNMQQQQHSQQQHHHHHDNNTSNNDSHSSEKGHIKKLEKLIKKRLPQ